MKAHYDDNLMRAYLLGSLSAEDTETCDELSFTDDAFVARLQALEDDLVDAYAQGELSGAEHKQFESYYLASPRRQEKVNFARSLQTLAAQHSVAVAPAPETALPISETPAERTSTSWWQSWQSLFTLPNLTLQWGMAAAALLFLLLGGWLLVETQRLRGQMDAAQTQRAALQQREQELRAQLEQQRAANARTLDQLNAELKRTEQQLAELKRQQQQIAQQPRTPAQSEPPNFQHVELTPQTRTLGKPFEVVIAAGTDFAILQLVTPEDDYVAHRVELLNADGQRLWRSGTLKARPSGTARVLDVSVRAKLLPPGSYVVQLQGIAADGQSEDIRKYSFKVVKP
jgi:anti-sigma factor RsiW